ERRGQGDLCSRRGDGYSRRRIDGGGMIRKVLVANRGEIAVRVMRACREMGIAAVAAYSEADKEALFVKYADEAFLLGPAPARASYLNIEKVIDTAKQCGADAIH